MQPIAEYNPLERVGVKFLAIVFAATLIPRMPKFVVSRIDRHVIKNALRYRTSKDPVVTTHANSLLIVEPEVSTFGKLAATQAVIGAAPLLIDGIHWIKLDKPERDIKELEREHRKCAGHSLQNVELYLTDVIQRGQRGGIDYDLAVLKDWRNTAINYRKQVNNLLGL